MMISSLHSEIDVLLRNGIEILDATAIAQINMITLLDQIGMSLTAIAMLFTNTVPLPRKILIFLGAIALLLRSSALEGGKPPLL